MIETTVEERVLLLRRLLPLDALRHNDANYYLIFSNDRYAEFLDKPLDLMPLYINDGIFSDVAAWRLEIAK